MFTPTSIKVLNHLKDSKEKASPNQLAIIIDEGQEHVNKALEKLVAADVVIEEQGFYTYNPTPTSEELLANLIKTYDTVDKRRADELFTKAVICEIPPRYLFHFNTLLEMLEQEGIPRRKSQGFLHREIAQGYLRRVRIARLGTRPFPLPKYIPPYWFSHLRMIRWEEYQGFKQDPEGHTIQEDDYLTQRYPAQLAHAAREHLGKKRDVTRDTLRRKGLLDNLGRFW